MSVGEKENPFAEFNSVEFLDGEPVAPKAPSDVAVADATLAGDDEAHAQPESGENEPAKETDKEADSESDETSASTEKDKENVTEEADKEPAKEPAKPRRSAQDRIDQAVKRQREAERRASDLESRLSALERGEKKELTPATEPAKDNKAPKAEDYEFGQLDDAYIADKVSFETQKAIAAHEATQVESRQRDAAVREAQEFADNARSMYEKGVEKYEDFQDLIDDVKADDWPLSETMARLLVKSDVGADIAYHLYKHPKEAKEVAGKAIMDQAAHFGRLEARFSAKAAPKSDIKPPKLQAPVQQPRGAGGQFSVAPDTSDFSAFEAMAMAKKG